MPNFFKRALHSIGGFISKADNMVVVGDKNKYLQSKVNNAWTGTALDISKPELVSTVYTCVSLIANNIAKLNLHVYKTTGKGREIFTDHPWEKVLSASPDGRLSQSKFQQLNVSKMLFEGTTYYYVQEFTDDLRLEKRLVPLNDKLEAIIEDNGDIWYKFKRAGWFPSKQLVINYVLTKDGIKGIPPLDSLRNELKIQVGAEQTMTNFYKNGLFQVLYTEQDLAGAMVSLGNNANTKQMSEYYKKLEADYTGARNAFEGGILNVPAGLKLSAINLPDLKFLDSSRYTEARIASVFNVPSFMLNIDSTAVLNAETMQIHFLNNCLSNITNALAKEYTYKLLSQIEREAGVYIDFDYNNIFTLDTNSKATYLTNIARFGAVSPNDIREAFGLERLDNEFMDRHFLQTQNQSIEDYPMWARPAIGCCKQTKDKLTCVKHC